MADSSIARIKSRGEKNDGHSSLPNAPFFFPIAPSSDTSSAEAIRLLSLHRAVGSVLIPKPSASGNLARPFLWHTDLHNGNIFISSEGKVSGIIDWQHTPILPLFCRVVLPRSMEIGEKDMIFELPSDFKFRSEREKFELRNKFRASMLKRHYMAATKEKIPEVNDFLTVNEVGAIRKQTFGTVGGSFEHSTDVILLREHLLRMQLAWNKLISSHGNEMDCPISINGDELSRHQADGKIWTDFKNDLQARTIPVSHDGWVPKQDFVVAKKDLMFVMEEYLRDLGAEIKREQFLKNLELWKVTDINPRKDLPYHTGLK